MGGARLIELFIVGVTLAFGVVIHEWKKSSSKKKMAAIDRGELCIGCESADVERDGSAVRCLTCGCVSSLEALRAAQVADHELAKLTDPLDRPDWRK